MQNDGELAIPSFCLSPRRQFTEKSEASQSRILDAVTILVSERLTLDTILQRENPDSWYPLYANLPQMQGILSIRMRLQCIHIPRRNNRSRLDHFGVGNVVVNAAA